MADRTILSKILKISLLFLVVLTAFTGCAIAHTYGPYSGKVIDIETKEPLEGTAVLAVYYTEEVGPGGSVSHFLDAQETLTDKNGEFKISSNTVTTFRPFQSFKPWTWFTIFKPGYGCYPWHKGVKPMFVPNGTLPPDQYVIIELPALKIKEERLRNQSCFPVSIPDEKMEKFIEVNNIERMNLGLEPSHLRKKK